MALFHLSSITFYPTVSPPSIIAWLVEAGSSGVSLFFIISAFTMCLSTEGRNEKGFVSFFVRRFFRIAPLFYLWIVLACARDYLIFDKVHSGAEILWNSIFLINFKRDYIEAIPWAGWTIGVEMAFYACFPFIFRLTRTIRDSAIILAVFLAVGVQWSSHFFIEHNDVKYATLGFVSRLPIFLLGILLYRVYLVSDVLQQQWRKYFSIGAIVSGLVMMVVASKEKIGLGLLPVDYTQSLAWALVMYGLLISPKGIISYRPLLFVGEISYSIYLSHATVLHLLSMAGLYSAIASVTGDSGFVFYFTSFFLGMIGVVAVSYITYLFVESPGIRLGSYLLKRPVVRQFIAEK
ncbi:acyltransferase [Pseudomonas yamanorum]|nr:acyltransferase [Pseudomonas yamanorum]